MSPTDDDYGRIGESTLTKVRRLGLEQRPSLLPRAPAERLGSARSLLHLASQLPHLVAGGLSGGHLGTCAKPRAGPLAKPAAADSVVDDVLFGGHNTLARP